MNNTMRQAVMTAPGRIRIVDCAVPQPAENEILVKVDKIGICGSDIHVYKGEHPFTEYPVVQGHEVSGIVIRKGSRAAGAEPGDKVVLRPQIVCGKCRQCRDGDYHICENLKVMGFQAPGAASEYFSVDAGNIIKVPSDMDDNAAVMTEPLAVGVHAVKNAGDITDLNVLVIGGGTIGNLTAQTAKVSGAASVMVSDMSSFRLNIALSCGIDSVFKADSGDFDKYLAEKFGEDRADIIFDCVGTEKSLETALSIARKGTKIIAVGVYPGKILADMSLVQDRELKILGSLMYKHESMLKAAELLYSGKISYKGLITHEFSFNDYASGYEAIEKDKDRALKVIINLNRQ